MWKLITRVRTQQNKRSEFILTIASLIIDSRGTENNVGFDYEIDREDQNIITITSFWTSHDDLKKYMESELFKIMKGAIKLLCDKEETNYHEITI